MSPQLADKVIAPEKSFFRRARSGDWLAQLDRIARENGYPESWRLTDAEREATRARCWRRATAGTCGCSPTAR